MNQPETSPRPPRKTRQSPVILAIILLMILFGVMFMVNRNQQGSRDLLPEQPLPSRSTTGLSELDLTTVTVNRPQIANMADGADGPTAAPAAPATPATIKTSGSPETAQSVAGQDTLAALPPALPAIAPQPRPGAAPAVRAKNNTLPAQTCTQASDKLESFYHTLDRRDYIRGFSLATASRAHFSGLIKTMLDQPPIVSGETSDLFTLLQNTAHFFKIIGKDNILLFKAILTQERDGIEDLAAALYTLTKTPSCSGQSRLIQENPEAIYDYAGFFLNTMAGRLYLFRRDSFSRLLVNYYSILIIQDANQDNRNRHGINLAPAIDTLIRELEQSGETLRYRENYLDQLYLFKEQSQ